MRVLLKVIDGSTLLFPCPCFFIYFFVCGGGEYLVFLPFHVNVGCFCYVCQVIYYVCPFVFF